MSRTTARIPLIAGVLVGALALSACGTTTDSEGAGPVEDRGPVDKILFDYPFTALPVYSILVPAIEAHAAERGVTVEFTNDDMDLGKQVTNLNTYLTSDVDAVVSFPADPASLESIAKAYQDAGKYWVTYGGDLETQDATLQFSFYDSGHQLGEYAGQWASENIDGTATVLVLEDQTIQIGQERTQGLLDGLEESGADYEIVAQQQAVTPDEGLTVTSSVLAQNPDVDIVLGAVGDASQGAYQALLAAGRDPKDAGTFLGGLDPNITLFKAMRDGGFVRGIGFFVLMALIEQIVDIPIALGEGVEDASVDIPVEIVTPDSPDLDAYIAQLGG
jgi:ribose transport system substrate-binding protein